VIWNHISRQVTKTMRVQRIQDVRAKIQMITEKKLARSTEKTKSYLAGKGKLIKVNSNDARAIAPKIIISTVREISLLLILHTLSRSSIVEISSNRIARRAVAIANSQTTMELNRSKRFALFNNSVPKIVPIFPPR